MHHALVSHVLLAVEERRCLSRKHRRLGRLLAVLTWRSHFRQLEQARARVTVSVAVFAAFVEYVYVILLICLGAFVTVEDFDS